MIQEQILHDAAETEAKKAEKALTNLAKKSKAAATKRAKQAKAAANARKRNAAHLADMQTLRDSISRAHKKRNMVR